MRHRQTANGRDTVRGDAEGGVWMAGVWTGGGSGAAVESDNAAAGSADSGDGKSDTAGAGRNVTVCAGDGNPQQAYQQTPPRPVAAQAGYQQASGKQDLKTIGRAILPVCAAGLIFLSLVFLRCWCCRILARE